MRGKLRENERLPHQIVRAQIEHPHAILRAGLIGENQNWQIRRVARTC